MANMPSLNASSRPSGISSRSGLRVLLTHRWYRARPASGTRSGGLGAVGLDRPVDVAVHLVAADPLEEPLRPEHVEHLRLHAGQAQRDARPRR